jgi:hypothetical protein
MARARVALLLACVLATHNGMEIRVARDHSSVMGLSQRMTKALVALSGNPDVAKLYKNIEQHGRQEDLAAKLREFDEDSTMSPLIENITQGGLPSLQKSISDPSLRKEVRDRLSFLELFVRSTVEGDVADANAGRIMSKLSERAKRTLEKLSECPSVAELKEGIQKHGLQEKFASALLAADKMFIKDAVDDKEAGERQQAHTYEELDSELEETMDMDAALLKKKGAKTWVLPALPPAGRRRSLSKDVAEKYGNGDIPLLFPGAR